MQPQINSYNYNLRYNQASIAGETLRELSNYAEYMYNRNLKVFSQNILQPSDFVSEVFCSEFCDIAEAKKIILDKILKEKRRLIANIQMSERRSQFDVRDKKCCDCKKTFPIAMFPPRVDKSTGFLYYSSYCPECSSKRKKAAYAKSDKMKQSNRERQRRWRVRQRKQKAEAA